MKTAALYATAYALGFLGCLFLSWGLNGTWEAELRGFVPIYVAFGLAYGAIFARWWTVAFPLILWLLIEPATGTDLAANADRAELVVAGVLPIALAVVGRWRLSADSRGSSDRVA